MSERHSLLGTYLLIAMLVVGWGGIKIGWEHRLTQQQIQLRYHGLNLTSSLHQQIGLGPTLAVLGGLQALVANYFWVCVQDLDERGEWFKVKSYVEIATALQPRSVTFWRQGSFEFAWNAALDRLRNPNQPLKLLRQRDERYWNNQGIELLKRGIAQNPEKMDLWFQLGWLYETRTHNYLLAAAYFQEALKRPSPPQYLERFVGYDLEKGGDLPAAYAWWKGLWYSTTDRSQKFRAWDWVEKHIRTLETELQVPQEKRVFPESNIRESDQS